MTGKPPRPSSRRHLSQEEHELWTHVTREVKRLRRTARAVQAGRHPASASQDKTEISTPAATHVNNAKQSGGPAPKPEQKPLHKPLAPIEPKVRRRLSRGQVDVAARIDLHGMRQHQAHGALLGFLGDAHASGMQVVLVITGKGGTMRPDGGAAFQEGGVLRRLVPHWLAEPSLRNIVLGFETASARHGGEGALYVRLRRAGLPRTP